MMDTGKNPFDFLFAHPSCKAVPAGRGPPKLCKLFPDSKQYFLSFEIQLNKEAPALLLSFELYSEGEETSVIFFNRLQFSLALRLWSLRAYVCICVTIFQSARDTFMSGSSASQQHMDIKNIGANWMIKCIKKSLRHCRHINKNDEVVSK